MAEPHAAKYSESNRSPTFGVVSPLARHGWKRARLHITNVMLGTFIRVVAGAIGCRIEICVQYIQSGVYTGAKGTMSTIFDSVGREGLQAKKSHVICEVKEGRWDKGVYKNQRWNKIVTCMKKGEWVISTCP